MHSCVYCGEASSCLDHVIPYSYTSALSSGRRSGSADPGFRVPSCAQCNSILGDRIFANLVERKEYVNRRLKVRLERYSATVAWDESEMGGLGPNLRHSVEVMQAKRTIARDRLRYSAAPPDARWLEMEDRWRKKMGDPGLSLVSA